MATRRRPALPKFALAAALGVTALAATAGTAAAADHAASHPAGKNTNTAFPASYGNVKDWNTMVPEGENPAS